MIRLQLHEISRKELLSVAKSLQQRPWQWNHLFPALELSRPISDQLQSYLAWRTGLLMPKVHLARSHEKAEPLPHGTSFASERATTAHYAAGGIPRRRNPKRGAIAIVS